MDNEEQRDHAEEAANRRLLRECDSCGSLECPTPHRCAGPDANRPGFHDNGDVGAFYGRRSAPGPVFMFPDYTEDPTYLAELYADEAGGSL